MGDDVTARQVFKVFVAFACSGLIIGTSYFYSSDQKGKLNRNQGAFKGVVDSTPHLVDGLSKGIFPKSHHLTSAGLDPENAYLTLLKAKEKPEHDSHSQKNVDSENKKSDSKDYRNGNLKSGPGKKTLIELKAAKLNKDNSIGKVPGKSDSSGSKDNSVGKAPGKSDGKIENIFKKDRPNADEENIDSKEKKKDKTAKTKPKNNVEIPGLPGRTESIFPMAPWAPGTSPGPPPRPTGALPSPSQVLPTTPDEASQPSDLFPRQSVVLPQPSKLLPVPSEVIPIISDVPVPSEVITKPSDFPTISPGAIPSTEVYDEPASIVLPFSSEVLPVTPDVSIMPPAATDPLSKIDAAIAAITARSRVKPASLSPISGNRISAPSVEDIEQRTTPATTAELSAPNIFETPETALTEPVITDAEIPTNVPEDTTLTTPSEAVVVDTSDNTPPLPDIDTSEFHDFRIEQCMDMLESQKAYRSYCCGRTDLPVMGGIDLVGLFYAEPGSLPLPGKTSISSEMTTSFGTYTFLFSTPENKQKFDREPWRYVPQYGGFCACGMALEDKVLEPGYKSKLGPFIDVGRWTIVDDRLFFFGGPEPLEKFMANAPSNTELGDEHWSTIWNGQVPSQSGIINTNCFHHETFEDLVSGVRSDTVCAPRVETPSSRGTFRALPVCGC